MVRLFHVQQILLKVYLVGQDPVHKPLQEQEAINSVSSEDADPSPKEQIVGRASALINHIPSPYDKEALKYKVEIRRPDRNKIQKNFWKSKQRLKNWKTLKKYVEKRDLEEKIAF